MKEYTTVIASAAVGSLIGGTVAWLFSSSVWAGAIIGALVPLIFFAGAVMAILGLFQVLGDYLKENSR